MSDVVRVAMWSGPRNISTAMMRAFENRPDAVVVDEPLYAAYLARTGIEHPAREAVIASQPTDLAEAVAALSAPLPPGSPRPLRQAHGAPRRARHGSALDAALPQRAARSATRSRSSPPTCARGRPASPTTSGCRQQEWLLELWDEHGIEVPILDAGDFLRAPEAHLRWLCDWLGIPFTDRACCPGRRGRAPPTACGRRTGTPRSGPPPASHPGARASRRLSDHDAAVAEACRPIYARLHARRVRL